MPVHTLPIAATVQCYRICTVGIHIECQAAAHAEQLDRLWQQIFALQRGAAGDGAPRISLDLSGDGVWPPPPQRTTILATPQLQIWRAGSTFYLQAEDALLNLDLARSTGRGRLHRRFWQLPLWVQRDFFLMALVMLLHGQERYGLHANGVVWGEQGVLVSGASGSGKSTLTMALMQAGWSYLADDVLILQAQGAQVEALALRRGFALTPDTLAAFADWLPAGIGGHDLDGHKQLIQAESLFPHCFVQRCLPHLLLFPQIDERQHTVLTPMDRTAALVALLIASAGIAYDRIAARRQMACLNRLVQQTHSYRLLLGRDVFQEPEAVAWLLANAIRAKP